MKKVIVAVLVVVLSATMLFAGCQGTVTGSGNLETKQFNLSDFTKVDIGSAFQFEIVQSDSYRISITADDNLFEHMRVDKEGQTLKIGIKTISLRWPVTLKAAINLPQLHGLDISGASEGSVSNFSSKEDLDIQVSGASSLDLVDISAGDVKFDVSGASKVTGDIIAGDVNFDVSGASSIQLEGSASDIAVESSGASQMKLGSLTVDNADISLSGASTGTINLSGRLDADLSGASKLEYMGEPTLGTMNITRASKLNKK